MAAPLESSSSNSSSKTRPPPQEEIKKPAETFEIPNQKLCLLHALLSVGALRPSFAMLSKCPWLVDAFPEIADLILRILKHSLSPLYTSQFPSGDWSSSFLQPRARYGNTGVAAAPERKPQLTLAAPTPPCTSTTDFIFFFPEWSQRVPLCITMDDLINVLEPLMRFIGLHVSRDPGFLSKFLRLGRINLLGTVSTFWTFESGSF